MRPLFALTVLFALTWAGTSIATSWERADRLSVVVLGAEENRPSQTYVTLSSLNYAAYSAGTACLAIMGASLITRTYRRIAG